MPSPEYHEFSPEVREVVGNCYSYLFYEIDDEAAESIGLFRSLDKRPYASALPELSSVLLEHETTVFPISAYHLLDQNQIKTHGGPDGYQIFSLGAHNFDSTNPQGSGVMFHLYHEGLGYIQPVHLMPPTEYSSIPYQVAADTKTPERIITQSDIIKLEGAMRHITDTYTSVFTSEGARMQEVLKHIF